MKVGLFFHRLLEFIDDVIESHKDTLLLNSEEILSGNSQPKFDTIDIDRLCQIL